MNLLELAWVLGGCALSALAAGLWLARTSWAATGIAAFVGAAAALSAALTLGSSVALGAGLAALAFAVPLTGRWAVPSILTLATLAAVAEPTLGALALAAVLRPGSSRVEHIVAAVILAAIIALPALPAWPTRIERASFVTFSAAAALALDRLPRDFVLPGGARRALVSLAASLPALAFVALLVLDARQSGRLVALDAVGQASLGIAVGVAGGLVLIGAALVGGTTSPTRIRLVHGLLVTTGAAILLAPPAILAALPLLAAVLSIGALATLTWALMRRDPRDPARRGEDTKAPKVALHEG